MTRLIFTICFWLMTLSVANAAVTFVNSASLGQNPGAGTTVALNCGTAPNRLVVVAFAILDATNQASSMSYNSVALSNYGAKVVSTGVTVEWWYLNGAASGSNTLSITPTASDSWAAIATCVSGVDPTNPLGTRATATAAAKTISVNVTGVANGMIIDALAKDDNPNEAEPVGAGQTEAIVGGLNEGTNVRGQSSRAIGVGTVTMSWGTSTNFFNLAQIAVPLNPAIGQGGAPFVFQ